MRLWATIAALMAMGPVLSWPVPAAERAQTATLIGYAVLPADTFRDGPPSGQFNDRNERRATPRFASQPVQGISSLRAGPAEAQYWALSDNGFGNKWNSADYRLAIYLLELRPKSRREPLARITLLRSIELRDPLRQFPWRLTLETDPARPLTGADVDPESLVVLPDGSFWVSDEIGPWLLHFSAAGELLAPPTGLPGELRSPQHPLVLANQAAATVGASSGLEGLTLAADGRHLIAALEKPLATDAVAADAALPLRWFSFDLERHSFEAIEYHYPLPPTATSLGELTHLAGSQYLVLERDDGAGAAAQWKRITQWDLNAGSDAQPRTVVDLLAIHDPDNLAGYGRRFALPYFTIEAVHVIDPRTLLVVNDNNYPATGGRGADVADTTEFVWLRLARPLYENRSTDSRR